MLEFCPTACNLGIYCYIIYIYNYQKFLIHIRVTRLGTFEVCVPTHVASRIFVMQVLVIHGSIAFSDKQKRWTDYSAIIMVNQLHKNRGGVALLTTAAVHSVYYDGVSILECDYCKKRLKLITVTCKQFCLLMRCSVCCKMAFDDTFDVVAFSRVFHARDVTTLSLMLY